MLKYNIDYRTLVHEGLEGLKLDDGKYKIFYSYSILTLLYGQTRDVLLGHFEIQGGQLSSFAFEKDFLSAYHFVDDSLAYKFIINADEQKQLIIEREETREFYYFFNENMKLSLKEFVNDELDRQNKANHNYFERSQFEYNELDNAMKQHIKNNRFNLLSTFIFNS